MGDGSKDAMSETLVLPDSDAPSLATEQTMAGDSVDDASSETLAPNSPIPASRSSSKIRPSGYVIRPSGPMKIGRYVVERKLGAGGMGVVYLADDPELKRKVVIKLLRTELAESGSSADRSRLLREAQAMAKVSHPNVVPIYDVGVHDDQVFLAMEFIDGGDLAAWLKDKDAKRTIREVLDVFVAAGRGLAAAHRAGLVHRDFKPHNVMLGKDGSVKVTDFGLARSELPTPAVPAGKLELDRPRVTANHPGEPSVVTMLDSPLTQAGALVGTPAYMAPEQILAEPVDGRADQFSFCVALHEALYGERPFAGKTLDELFDSTLAGNISSALSRRRDIPGHIRDAIRRGLAVQPLERFASMDALLAAIAPRTRQRALVAVGAAGGVAIAAVATFLIVRGGTADEPKPAMCAGGPGELAQVWSPARKQQLEQSFVATKAGMARAAAAALAGSLDRYAASWQTGYQDACEATRVRGDQTEQVMEQRMRCLRRRRAELDAFVEVANKPDDELMTNATALVANLPDPKTCANVEALAGATVADPKRQAELELLDADLAKARALQAANRLDAAAARLGEVLAKAEKIGHKPIVAELHLELGRTALQKLDVKTAEEHLHRAVEIAEQASADRIRAVAFMHLITIAAGTGRLEEAERWVRYATATTERLGDERSDKDRALLAELDLRTAEVYKLRGDTKRAEQTIARAIERLGAEHGARSREVAIARRDLATFYHGNHDFDRAYTEHETVRDIMREVHGRENIEVAASVGMMAAIRYEQKRFEEAMALDEEALEGTKQYFGTDHPVVAQAYSGYALKLQSIGRNDAALAMMNRSIAIMVKHYGTDHALHASALGQLALLYANLERFDDAFATWQRAVDIYTKLNGGEGNADVVILLNAMGTMRRKQGRFDEALAMYERAKLAIAKFEAPGGRNMPDTLTRIGMIENQRKRHAKAIEALEPALALRVKGSAPPALMSWTKLELAQALWESSRDRKRALQLAREAEAEAKQDNDAEQIDLAGKWLAAHE